MTDSVHPTPDELADLTEGLLEGTEQGRVSAHLESCADCHEQVAALEEVRALLADAGRDTVAMPSDVADRLDAALARAQAERTAGVPSLDERRELTKERTTPTPAPVRRRGRLVLIGGAAAAAVVVLGGVVLDGIGDLGTGSGEDSADAGSAATDDSGGDALLNAPERESDAAPEEAPGDEDARQRLNERLYAFEDARVPTLSPDNAGAFASELAGVQAAKSARRTVPRACQPLARQTDAAASLSTRSRVAEVHWRGDGRALLVVDPASRTADVYGCGTDPRLLYTTSY